jgi:hypothetical protein
LTAAEPHAKETSHRAKAITSSDQRRQYTLRPNRGFGPRIFLHGLTACVASSAPQPFSRFDSVIAHLPSCLKWVFPDPSSPDHVMRPSVSTFATCSQLTPSSSNTRALARRANRCVTDPSRANATRGGTFLSRQKAGENHAPTGIQYLALGKSFFAFSMSWGILPV